MSYDLVPFWLVLMDSETSSLLLCIHVDHYVKFLVKSTSFRDFSVSLWLLISLKLELIAEALTGHAASPLVMSFRRPLQDISHRADTTFMPSSSGQCEIDSIDLHCSFCL